MFISISKHTYLSPVMFKGPSGEINKRKYENKAFQWFVCSEKHVVFSFGLWEISFIVNKNFYYHYVYVLG